jgi:preprotein translocase subunit YajC
MMLPLAMFAAIFYFLIIRPQKKKQKAHEEMLASISRGSTVITAGGFYGVVREILDDSYIIELGEGVKARILKSSISMKKSEGAADLKPKKKKLKKNNEEVTEGTEGTETSETAAETVQEAETPEAPVEKKEEA